MKNYNISLDIGTNSVGWAVSDEENNLLKHNGKNMWGSRIFETADTAQGRRTYRGAKRRLRRRKQRIDILQSLLLEDIQKEYPNFLQMIRQTDLDFNDKVASKVVSKNKYNLFSEEEMTDTLYYNDYPTIYHLRNELVNKDDKKDIRFVYLAIHHIIKYRGNFLHEGDFSKNTSEIEDSLKNILNFIKEKYDINVNIQINEIIEILSNKAFSKSEKKEILISKFSYSKQDKAIITNIIAAILGYSFDINKIFEIEVQKNKVSFAKDIEEEDEIKQDLEDNIEEYEALKNIYSYYTLQDILKGKEYISEAFIEKYDKYNNDLKLLKRMYKKYLPNEYKNMFQKVGENNYVAYNGKNKGKTCKRCREEEFFTFLKKQINKLPQTCKEKEDILKQIENNDFLRKLNVTDNGQIPYQIHKKELEKILENQAKYYKSISENKEKIISLLTFRIPYYIGPLSKNAGKWSWIVRKSNESIRPWKKLEDIIDEDATAEAFIRRMTNKCTYLLNKDVIPKQSLLYSKFCVLNELNNVKINNRHIARDLKNKIIEELFKKKKKVTKNMLENFYKKEMKANEINIDGLSDNNTFISNMAPYIDLKSIFGQIDETNYKMCEDIIYWVTIFEEKKILKRKIKKEYPNISEDELNKISRLKYTGWSRLSEELLTQITAYDGDSIMDKLEKTTKNFMQIINEKEYGINKKIDELLPQKQDKITYDDIVEIQTSPANKRGIWQTMCVVKEIIKIMGYTPKNIYIEFARNEEKKNMKDNRVKQLLAKYEDIEKQNKYLKEYDPKVYKELKKNQSDKTLNEKVFLYCLQNGKCLYSGKKLDLDSLYLYEVDHIIPRTYVKDDSIDNKALVIRQENQRKKDNLLLAEDIINARKQWWESLKENGLMSSKKYFNLTRRKMFETNDDMDKFIQRQLVETRQITKSVTNLLKVECKTSEIFAIRANLTHEFRERFNIYKNRNINNYHHAHDAYILSIIGNIIDKNFKYKNEYKYSEYVKKYIKDSKDIRNKDKYNQTIIMNMIKENIDVNKIKKVFDYKDCYISRKLEEGTGEFYNQTIYSPNDKNVHPVIPLKQNRDVNKYGGYSGENNAYSVIFTYKNSKGKNEYRLIGIPIQVQYEIKSKKQTLEKYIKEVVLKQVEFTDLSIVKNKILKNQEYLDANNEPMRLCSDKEYRSNKELIVNQDMQELIYLMNSQQNKLNDDEIEKVKSNLKHMFQYLLHKLEIEYKVFENILQRLRIKQESFLDLDYESKKSTINGLISLMQTGQGNLKAIGLTDREGRKSGKTFKNDTLLNMTFIDKSVTGMYERRSKINGMENISC